MVVTLYFALCHMSRVRCHESARTLGLRLDNSRAAALQARVPVAFAVAVALAAGAALGTWHIEPVRLPLEITSHLVWGTAQQYGLLPNPFLISVTFLAGLVSCRLYRNVPNVLVPGAAHAAIALVLFYALPFSITHELRVGPGYFTAATETPRVN